MNKNESHLPKNEAQFLIRFILIILFCLILMSIAATNKSLIRNSIYSFEEFELSVNKEALYRLKSTDEILTITGNKSHFSFKPRPNKLHSLRINCSIDAADATAKLYYWSDREPFSRANFVKIELDGRDHVYQLPFSTRSDQLRMEFISPTGAKLNCSRLDANPLEYFVCPGIVTIFIFLALLTVALHIIFRGSTLIAGISNFIICNFFFISSLVLIILVLSYPVTVTHDGGHYLWLTSLIRSQNWRAWDPVRNIGFPAYLLISELLLGKSTLSILLPSALLLVTLYYCMVEIMRTLLPGLSKREMVIVETLLLFLVVFDPIVFGYYHTLLTEFMVATIAMASVLFSLRAFIHRNDTKYYYYCFSLLLLAILSWQIKQPYVGAVVIPLLVALFLVLISKTTQKALKIIGVGLVVVIFFISADFLISSVSVAKSINQEREFTTVLKHQILNRDSGKNIIEFVLDHYLTSINYYRYEYWDGAIVKAPSFLRSYQNNRIAYNTYRAKETGNLFLPPTYRKYVEYLLSYDTGPVWINKLFVFRQTISNFIFTLTFLFAPILVIISFAAFVLDSKIMRRPIWAAAAIMTASAFLNVLIHAFAGAAPLDRYAFWGYPLLLENGAILILFTLIGKRILRKSYNPNL